VVPKDAGVVQGGNKAKPSLNATSQIADAKASAVPADAAKVQDAKFMATLEAMKVLQGGSAEPVVTPAAASTANPSTMLERSTSERLQLREQDAGGQYTPQFNAMGATSYASSSVQEAGAASPEMYVAQQVSYWISQDVQNAELTLDGLGKSPVEVSISMSGNEAHITFRSDEAQTLSLLDGATAHLKDMLQGQGVVLSGVSVGTSGSGEAGDGERRQRQGARQQSATVPVAVAEARRMPAGSAGRTLDLFV
jgi:flagellar hook-length control protein FliK